MERSEDVTDRRAKLLRLTPEGREIVARIRKTVVSLENELLSPFSDGEIARVAEFIERLGVNRERCTRRGKR